MTAAVGGPNAMRYLAIVFLFLATTTCTLINPETGEELNGLPTAMTAQILRDFADDLEMQDTDGVVNEDDLPAIAFLLTSRILSAMQDFNRALPPDGETTADVDR